MDVVSILPFRRDVDIVVVVDGGGSLLLFNMARNCRALGGGMDVSFESVVVTPLTCDSNVESLVVIRGFLPAVV